MKEVRVTPAEVRAAKLLVEVDKAEGRATPEAIREIAEAKPRTGITSETLRWFETTSEPSSLEGNRLFTQKPSSPEENKLFTAKPGSPDENSLLTPKSGSRRRRFAWRFGKEDNE